MEMIRSESEQERRKPFAVAIDNIKKKAREDRECLVDPRPSELVNLTHDTDSGCYRWIGSHHERPYWSVVSLSKEQYYKYRILETEHQRHHMAAVCTEKNHVIVELECLIYTVLDDTLQRQNMSRKLRAIQTILDDDPI